MKSVYLVGRVNEQNNYFGKVHVVSSKKKAEKLQEYINNIYIHDICIIEKTTLH